MMAVAKAVGQEVSSSTSEGSNTNGGRQGHKRKASEMDSELTTSKSKREKSTTVDDERMYRVLPLGLSNAKSIQP
jgi:hypothetical protein